MSYFTQLVALSRGSIESGLRLRLQSRLRPVQSLIVKHPCRMAGLTRGNRRRVYKSGKVFVRFLLPRLYCQLLVSEWNMSTGTSRNSQPWVQKVLTKPSIGIVSIVCKCEGLTDDRSRRLVESHPSQFGQGCLATRQRHAGTISHIRIYSEYLSCYI